MAKRRPNNQRNRKGFRKPTTTPTPDEIFDVWLSELKPSELKVLLYIVRRTFGFGKDADRISLNQICNGITTKAGKVLDRGTGLSRKAASQAVQSLEERGLIKVGRAVAEDGVNQINTYSLLFQDDDPASQKSKTKNQDQEGVVAKSNHGGEKSSQGVVAKSNHGGSKSTPGVVAKGNPQQTVIQQTEGQQTENIVVVEKLKKWNFSGEKIQELTAKYAPAYIEEKIEFLEWKLDRQENDARRPGRPIEDPAGWLIRAIEKDYKAPKGFKTHAQRAEEEEEMVNQIEEQTKAAERQRQQKLAALNDRYGTTERELDLWQEALDSLQLQMPRATFETWFPRTQLLSLKDNTALIGVPNWQAKDWLENRLSNKIQQTLAGLLDHPVEKLSFEIIDQALAAGGHR